MRHVLVLGLLSLAACGGNKGIVFDEDTGTGPTTDGGPIGDEVFITPGDGGGDGNVMQTGCSPDLRQVLDANGNVLVTCPPDQGCAGGTCVPACQAAGASKGSVGCDFQVATPSFFADLYPGYYAPCFAVFVANNWPKDVKITVTRNGQTYNVTSFGRIPQPGVPPASWQPVPANGVPPGQVAVLFLAHNASANYKCPAGPALAMGTQVDKTGRGQAWHIQTDYPVSGYDILPFGGASSFLPGATLLLPTTAWGTNYVGVVPKLGSGSQAGKGGPHWGQIVATEANTTVDVVPPTALPSGTNVTAAPANMKSTYTLANPGDYIQWQGPFTWASNPSSTAMDLSGMIVSSNKPVAFNGGNGYLCLGSQTSSGGGCDSDHEQIPPVQALGSEYVAAPFVSRLSSGDESIPYRIVGAADQTQLTYDPPVMGAPATIKLGQMLEFEAKGAFTIKSQDAQHPFYVGAMMPGCNTSPPGALSGQGDEDYTNVLPPAQYLKKYVFFTDPTYTTTSFSLVRTKTSQGFQDVNIDCVGKVSGWKPVGTGGKYESAVVTILLNNAPQFNNCQNGPHTAESPGPFGLTVWGLASYASYGYPAGGNVASINSVVIPPIPPN